MSNSEARKREELLSRTAEDELKYAVEKMASAKETYRQALVLGARAGMTNRKMGEIAGVTEAAIRMYRKRHQL